jgi:hypothetical protein
MKLKYENYMLDKTVPEYLVATLVSLVMHSVDREKLLWDTYTLVRSVKLTKSQISVSFVDGTEKVVILGDSEPYWSETEVIPVFWYLKLEPERVLEHILLEVVDILYVES